jgi:aspartyl-tRNA(Asn)/glutamyl-tRNA(Gln) amidotransferase subunit B
MCNGPAFQRGFFMPAPMRNIEIGQRPPTFALMDGSTEYEIVIGLEVHAQLLTRSKLFCADTTAFGLAPNSQVSPVSLGHPGTLPRLNNAAIEMAVMLGMATNCTLVRENYFARKHYFYPDLPKGYQISQHTTPICREGYLDVQVNGTTKRIRLNRIHIEEDAGKSLHDEQEPYTRLDYNRAGMPLLEIVTEPDLRSADEAFAFVTSLRKLVRHLGVCDGNMEQGSLRCDVNLSVRPLGETTLGTKVEIKNLNSIRFIKKAILSESARLIDLHRRGETILQQTRGLNETDFSTYAIRTKEDEDDYRYFPEPDLPPFYLTDALIEDLKQRMPPLAAAEEERLQREYGLGTYDAAQLAGDTELIGFFEAVHAACGNAKASANWTLGPVRNSLISGEEESLQISPASVAGLIRLIDEGAISFGIAVQRVFPKLLVDPSLPVTEWVEQEGLLIQSNEAELDELIEKALSRHAQKITEYKRGKKGLLSLFVGEVMKLSGGKADARTVNEKMIQKLNER